MIHMSENPMNKGRHVETGIFSALKKIKTDARDQKNNVKSMLKQIKWNKPKQFSVLQFNRKLSLEQLIIFL